MSEAKCPACRGGLVQVGCCEFDGGVECSRCGLNLTEVQDFAPLAYFDPRDRLPTEEEERARRAAHGEWARWMIRVRWRSFEDGREWDDWGIWSDAASMGGTDEDDETQVEVFPHVNGRPVRGPRGW